MQQQTSGHTLKAFDQDIDRLRALISQMGGLAEHAIGEAMRCLVQRDSEGAEQVIRDDKKLDVLEVETERRAVQLIALRAPMAGDLRDVVAALKISGVVERIGDYAKNIAKRVPLLENAGKIEPISLLPEMARIATGMVHDVLDAFVERDTEAAIRVCQRDVDAARNVVANDAKLDAIETEIEREAVQLIALRAPMADDLRDVVAALKIAGVVERIGDYAKNIAKRVPVLGDSTPSQPLSLLSEMGRIATEMVHNALNAYAARDAEGAVAVCERDTAVDDFYNSIFRTLLTFMMESPQNITGATHLLFIAKNLERIGDHATNVAEMVYFAATGAHITERPRGRDPITQ